jgi:hypothetical protein
MDKIVEFKMLMSVTKEDLNASTGDFNATWHFKFNLLIENETIECFARTKTERSYWLQSFCRVLDHN